jgi:two-component system, NarL family, nitrate/nitrite response regulator NarL
MSVATTTPALRILVVDDHQLLVNAIILGLRGHGHQVCAAADTSMPALVTELRRHVPTLVLLDLDLGDGLDGVHRIGPLRDAGATVVVVSGCTDPAVRADAFAAGAIGWISKSEPFDDLLAAVSRVADGQQLVSLVQRQAIRSEAAAERRARDTQSAAVATLTGRERVVLAGLMAGLRADEVAAEAFVSLATVRSQIRSILAKLGVGSQLAAVALAHEAGFRPAPR